MAQVYLERGILMKKYLFSFLALAFFLPLPLAGATAMPGQAAPAMFPFLFTVLPNLIAPWLSILTMLLVIICCIKYLRGR